MRSPLDRYGPSALNNQLLNTTGSKAVYFKLFIYLQPFNLLANSNIEIMGGKIKL